MFEIKRVFYLLLLLFLCYACRKEKDNTDCIYSQKIDLTQVCIEIYQPVCGCDQKTYSNICHAKINGLTSWQEGACDE
jgi:hypothetical protein